MQNKLLAVGVRSKGWRAFPVVFLTMAQLLDFILGFSSWVYVLVFACYVYRQGDGSEAQMV